MSFQINVPPSVINKMAKEEQKESAVATTSTASEDEPVGKKREDWRKLKELEEARKAGTAPAMQDEEGKDINPHIPQYIMQAPWYIGATQATLRHQREPDYMKKQFSQLGSWYKKGVCDDAVATKYRKGACENCGAMTHKKKDCLERPRKLGARFTGDSIAPDEHIQPDLGFDFEGKRDRWNGYDVNDYKRVLEDFQKQEEVKRQLKALKMEKSLLDSGGVDDNVNSSVQAIDDGEYEDDKYADDMAMPGQKFETKQRITVRNLRIREDTAKYLFNLDLNSAFYDPKTRAMRENPFSDKGLAAKDLPYAGDNFVRWSGDAHEMAKNQMFSWEAYEKGTEAHLQADPTKLEILQREYSKKKDDFKKTVKDGILNTYGGEEYLETMPKQLLLAQSENYVEYTRHGTILKGEEKAKVKSRYEEDIFEKNHTSVWGSYWREGHWGYFCCHSLIRQSYCVGCAGKENSDAEPSNEVKENDCSKKCDSQRLIPAYNPDLPKTLLQQHLEKRVAEEKRIEREERKREQKKKNNKHKGKKKRKRFHSSSSSESSSDDSRTSLNNQTNQLQQALKNEDRRLKEVELLMCMDEKKRPYNVMYDGKGPTAEDIEAYQMKRVRYDDPIRMSTSTSNK